MKYTHQIRVLLISVLTLTSLIAGCDTDGITEDEQEYIFISASSVVSIEYGEGAGNGQDGMPGVVLGEPAGYLGTATPEDVLSLGNGGSITLEFPAQIVDGSGADLWIYENPFTVGAAGEVYTETATIEVSLDGVEWHLFPFDYVQEATSAAEQFKGLAGVNIGGDEYDLKVLGLNAIRFIRITDCGKLTDTDDTRIMDSDGEFLDDEGNICCGGTSAGFDLDGVIGRKQPTLYQ